jgi:hypothetical protein
MPEDPVSSSSSEQPTLDRAAHHSAGSFGRYKLLQRLGEGGMGEVWLAEQTEPVRRQVALKVIKAGMDSAQAEWRGRVHRVTSGETRYFRAWLGLVAHLEALLGVATASDSECERGNWEIIL